MFEICNDANIMIHNIAKALMLIKDDDQYFSKTHTYITSNMSVVFETNILNWLVEMYEQLITYRLTNFVKIQVCFQENPKCSLLYMSGTSANTDIFKRLLTVSCSYYVQFN